MRQRDYIAILLIFALFILLLPSASLCQQRGEQRAWRQARIALLPLANHSDVNAARESIEGMIRKKLATRCVLVPADSLRDFMRSERMRLVGSVTAKSADKLRSEMDIDYVVTGAIEIYQQGVLPEFSLCLRAYNCWESEIVWLKCVSMTGQDLAGALKIGETNSLDQVVAHVVGKIMAEFDHHRDGLQFTRPKTNGKAAKLLGDGLVAVIPCDHSTLYPSADEVVSDLMLEEIWQQGYRVAEPGDVAWVLTRARELYFGAATDRGMKFLADSLNVKAVVSGTVFEFLPLKGQISVAGPLVAIGSRLVDPLSGEVISATDARRHGAEIEQAFGTGREYAIGKTTKSLVHDIWKRLVSEQRKLNYNDSGINHETVQR